MALVWGCSDFNFGRPEPPCVDVGRVGSGRSSHYAKVQPWNYVTKVLVSDPSPEPLGHYLYSGYSHHYRVQACSWSPLGSTRSKINTWCHFPPKTKIAGLFLSWDTMEALSCPQRSHHRFTNFWIELCTYVHSFYQLVIFLLPQSNTQKK